MIVNMIVTGLTEIDCGGVPVNVTVAPGRNTEGTMVGIGVFVESVICASSQVSGLRYSISGSVTVLESW